jgi:hypothetical protein
LCSLARNQKHPNKRHPPFIIKKGRKKIFEKNKKISQKVLTNKNQSAIIVSENQITHKRKEKKKNEKLQNHRV